MVTSNLSFKSNVYPIRGDLHSDKEFLGKIFDYSKLKELKDKYFSLNSNEVWTEFQRKIIDEGSLCLYAEKDPCFGLVKSSTGDRWVCKCVNKDCIYFKNCRPSFDENEYSLFSHKVNSLEDYEYGFDPSISKEGAPIFSKDEVFYDTVEEPREKKIASGNSDTRISINVLKLMDKEEIVPTVNPLTKFKEVSTDDYPIIKDEVAATTCVDPANDDIEEVFGQQYQEQLSIFDSFKLVEQEEIIVASPEDVIFVDAGPGTGKTYTLIKKIDYMVTHLGVDPETIIVLSFTNAAVTEIKNRLTGFVKKGGDRGLRNVDVRTFHSLAWWLLQQANEDKDLTNRGWEKYQPVANESDYDSSVQKAANLIARFPDFIEGWNLVVDEVQDLTGERANFVISLIKACLKDGNGVTVFGDFCQSIYDYSIDGAGDGISSEQFYKIVYQSMLGKGKYLKLGINHRQTEDLKALTIDYREALLSQQIDRMKNAVTELHLEIDLIKEPLRAISDKELLDLGNGKTVCLLCRNNGQTLRLSTTLHKRGISHSMNVYETKENLAPWIARVFFDYSSSNITQEVFCSLLKDKGVTGDGYSKLEMWNRIKELMHSRSDVIDVQDLLDAIRMCRIDEPLFRTTRQNPIIVSNIHRAKGREYESVIVDDAFIDGLEKRSDYTNAGEYKTLYVALTRPKSVLKRAKLSKFREVKQYTVYKTKRKRWASYSKKKLSHIELLYSVDVNKSTFILDTDVCIGNYSFIETGDEIKLKRRIRGGCVGYDIVHFEDDVETKLGVVSERFAEDISALVKPAYPADMPATIEDLYVESVYSHIEDKDFLKLHPEMKGKLKKCVWNWIDFRGLGHLCYDTY